ncbi:DUF2752 domain-containing protein [Pontibacter ramchanderi]|uniref:DUF2752 domain-containing protein n=1 Tax=Pontibacter ramchanderi TaxID=1179743 RepID=UPI001FE77EEA|nr:DUF2752 domain-containing protein [Pontibacter ramchanderi]
MQVMNRDSAFYAARYVLPEAGAWVLGLVLLAVMEPAGDHLFSLCPLSWIWPDGCPGCGLGHSIAYLFRGEWTSSWRAHPLGLPALLLLSWRVAKLSAQSRKLYLLHSKL